jgi:ABC-type Mn2+/Zn2+ transport system permease subunit
VVKQAGLSAFLSDTLSHSALLGWSHRVLFKENISSDTNKIVGVVFFFEVFEI